MRVNQTGSVKSHLVFAVFLILGQIKACESGFTADFITVLTGRWRTLWTHRPRHTAAWVCCDLWPFAPRWAPLCSTLEALSNRQQHALLHGRCRLVAPQRHSVLIRVFCRSVHHLMLLIQLRRRVKADSVALWGVCETSKVVFVVIVAVYW